jgi:hypothetical protein
MAGLLSSLTDKSTSWPVAPWPRDPQCTGLACLSHGLARRGGGDSGGGGERCRRRPRVVRMTRGGSGGTTTSPGGGLIGAALGLGLSGWGSIDKFRGCQRAAAGYREAVRRGGAGGATCSVGGVEDGQCLIRRCTHSPERVTDHDIERSFTNYLGTHDPSHRKASTCRGGARFSLHEDQQPWIESVTPS